MSPIALPKQLKKVQDRALLKALETGLETIETQLKSATTYADSVAKNPARHLVDAGGKRIRPALVLLAAQLGDPNKQEVFDAAVVVELTHLATLYHDDVMDDAPTRRGVPTAQHVWGNSVAILTGDLLFARASQVGANLGQESLTLQADTFERLCLGQLHETVGPTDGQDPIAHYIQVLADKTGSLIAASARLGILLSGAPAQYDEPMRVYGEKVGVAFQLIDDVIAAWKPRGAAVSMRVMTCSATEKAPMPNGMPAPARSTATWCPPGHRSPKSSSGESSWRPVRPSCGM